jgi:DNA-binding NarL/FixJ family response regulator
MRSLLTIGSLTGLAVVLYQASDFLLFYHYFTFEYYIAAVAVVALMVGIWIAKATRPRSAKEIIADPFETLTRKELEILQLILDGKSNKQIAALHFVEISTVKTHINNLYGKLGVSNRQNAVLLCRQHAVQTKSTLSPPVIN